MRSWALLMLSALLTACATAPPRTVDAFFNDPGFSAPSEPIRAEDVFALSPAMKAYLRSDIAAKLQTRGRQLGLVEALYNKGDLRLEYDSTLTRNAAQAFDARSGNCLSLVIMTAAFAKELGLAVQYQSLFTDETLARSGDIHFVVDHINLSLGKRVGDMLSGARFPEVITVDFLPPQDSSKLRVRLLSEQTVLAMYMNNRAAELLADGRLNDAYWWAREAIVQDPGFVRGYNTLGVVYRRHGDLAEAERALRHALAQQPQNPQIVSNLAQVVADQGRTAEAGALRQRLAQLETDPPFAFFERGRAAFDRGDYRTAVEMFRREVDRAPYYAEFHYWLAVSYAKLGDAGQARTQLALAMEHSSTRSDRALYAAKLDRIRSSQLQ